MKENMKTLFSRLVRPVRTRLRQGWKRGGLRLGFTLAAVTAAFLFSTPKGPSPLKRLDPAYAERGSEALRLLCDVRQIGGVTVYVPVPAAKVAERLAGAPEAWKKALRAELLERMGRLDEAEAAWKAYTAPELTVLESATALADFYKRRHEPLKEMAALEGALKSVKPGEIKTFPTPADIWSRIVALSANAGLDGRAQAEISRRCADWFRGTPQEEAYWRSWLEFLSEQQLWPEFDRGLAEFQKRFPTARETAFGLKAAACVSRQDGPGMQRLLDTEFNPLYSAETFKEFFAGMETLGIWKPFLYATEARLRADPLDLPAVLRIHHVKVYRDDLVAAANVLRDYRLLKTSRTASPGETALKWSAEDLAALGILSVRCDDCPEAVRYFAALYRTCPDARSVRPYGLSLQVTRAEALKATFRVMVRKTTESSEYWRESLGGLGTLVDVDREPGLPGALLTLLLGDENPALGLSNLEEDSRLAELSLTRGAERILAELKTLVPSEEYLKLKIDLADLYKRFAGSDASIRLLEEAAAESADPGLKRFALLKAAETAEAVAAKAVAERLYAQAAAVDSESAKSNPDQTTLTYWLGEAGAAQAMAGRWKGVAAYADYLVKENRRLEALAAWRKCLDANPDDEALYGQVAAFIEQKTYDAEAEAFYKAAYDRFQTSGWLDKAARLLLRQKREGDYQALTRRVVETFEGSALEKYLAETLPRGDGKNASSLFALQIYQAALDRFPLNRRFASQVLSYSRGLDRPRYEATVAGYYMISPEARDAYLQLLSRKGTLDAVLAAAPAGGDDDPAYASLKAEALAWRCKYEEALVYFRKVAEWYPDRADIRERFADLLQSLSGRDPARTAEAAALLQAVGDATGNENTYYTKAGDFLAMSGRMDEAQAVWRKILEIYPRDEEVWKSLATVHWDYYQFDRALDLLREIRKRTGKSDLYAFEVGALLQSQGKTREAMEEYFSMAASWQDRSWEAMDQLERMLKREASREIFLQLVEEKLKTAKDPVEVLRSVGNLQERLSVPEWPMAAWTRRILASARDADTVTKALDTFGNRLDKKDVIQARRKVVDLALPGTPRLQATFDLAEALFESGQEADALAVVVEAHRTNPANLGVIRRGVALCRKMGRNDNAEEIYAQALSLAVDPYRREFTVALADLQLEGKKWDVAISLADRWMTDHPEDFEVLGKKWAALAGANRVPDLIANYRDTLARLKTFSQDPARLREMETDVRLRIIECARGLGDYTLAIDHLVELLKLDPENRTYLETAYLLAERGNLFGRFEGILARFAADSPADYRWPLAQARWFSIKQDFKRSIEAYNACLAVVPERADIAEESLFPLEATMDLPAVESLCAKLAVRFPDLPSWQRRRADALRRLGRENEALAALQAWAEAAESSPVERLGARMRVCREWGLPAASLDLGLKILQEAAKEPAALDALERCELLPAARDAGKLASTCGALVDAVVDTSEVGDDRDRLENYLGSQLRDLLAGTVPAEVRAEVAAAFKLRLPKIVLLKDRSSLQERLREAFEAGGLSGQLKPLYQLQLQAENGSSLPWEMQRYHARRGMWGEISALLAVLARKSTDPAEIRSIRERRAHYAYLTGDAPAEAAILKALFADAVAPNSCAARYLEILLNAGRAAELGPGYSGVTHHQYVLAELLAYRRDYAGAAGVLQTLFSDQDPVWVKTNLARLGTFSGGALPVDGPYREVLRILPVRQLLDTEADSAQHLMSPVWARQMYAYSEWLLKDKARRADALSTIMVGLEQNHRRREEYETLFESALGAGDAPLAADALAWLEELKPLPLADTYHRVRLASLRGDVAELGKTYEDLMSLISFRSGSLGETRGEELLRIGREKGLMDRTAPLWRKLFLTAVGGGVPGDEVRNLFIRFLAGMKDDAVRAAWMLAFFRDASFSDRALTFFLENRLLREADLPGFAEAAEAKIGPELALGREARLYRLLKTFPSKRSAVPGKEFVPGAFLRSESLKNAVTAENFTEVMNALRKIGLAGATFTPETVGAWLAEYDRIDSWPDVLSAVCDELGDDRAALLIRKACLVKNMAGRLPSDDDLWALGAMEGQQGNKAEAVRLFTRALGQTSRRAHFAAQTVEKLLDLGFADAAGPFLAALRSTEPLAGRTVRLGLLAGVAIGAPAPDGAALDAFLRRPDIPVSDKTDFIARLEKKSAADTAWGQSVLTAVNLGQVKSWSEMNALLAFRLSLKTLGAKAALDGAKALPAAHADARILCADLLVEALAAKRGDVLAAAVIPLLRSRPGGDESDAWTASLLKAAVAAGKTLQVLPIVAEEAFGYSGRFPFLSADSEEEGSLGYSLASPLRTAGASGADVLLFEAPLAKVFQTQAWLTMARDALPWAIPWSERRALCERIEAVEAEQRKREAAPPFTLLQSLDE